MNAKHFPILARIALDVLAIPASSVPCERLFSAGKHIATNHRARLGVVRFEELQVLRAAWKDNIVDLAAWNSGVVEDVDMTEFESLLTEDISATAWDEELAGDLSPFIL